MDKEIFQVKTINFEGPFAVLLSLIEKRKLFINDVSLAQVTEDYLNYMGKIGELHPGEVSSFVLVASTLLLIKSKSLLPNLDLTDEEKGDIQNLEDRLRLYELFTRLSKNVKNNFGERIVFYPEERKNDVLVFLPDERITKESMMVLAQDLVNSIPKKVFLPKVEVKEVISIEEMIDKLTDRIKNSMKFSFKDFHGKSGVTKEEKIFAIVGFLAMLELVRQGFINADQESNTGDIIIEKLEKENINQI